MPKLVAKCAPGTTGTASDPVVVTGKVEVCGPDGGPIEVTGSVTATLAVSQFDALCKKFDSLNLVFASGAVPTPWCVPGTGEPIYLCKKTDADGNTTYVYQIVPEDASAAMDYDGPRERCEVATGFKVEAACFDHCISGIVCVDDNADIVAWSYVDPATNVQVKGTGMPTVPVSIGGACRPARKERRAVWDLDENGCPFPLGLFDVLCFGPKRMAYVTNEDGVTVLVDIDLEYPGAMVVDPDTGFCSCTMCLVPKKAFYDVGELSGLMVWWAGDATDCDAPFEPVTVTYGDPNIEGDAVTCEINPDDPPFNLPLAGSDCGSSTNTKQVTITGPAGVRAWAHEATEVC